MANFTPGATGIGPPVQRAGGATPTSTLNAAGLGPIDRIQNFGHSIAEGYGSSNPDVGRYASRVAHGIGAVCDNYAVDGGILQNTAVGTGGWADVFANNLMVSSRPKAAMIMHGINDAAFYNNVDTTAKAYAAALRASISRLRTMIGGVHLAPDASIGVDGSWSLQGAAPSGGSGNLGYYLTSANGAVATVTIPASWNGGVLSLLFGYNAAWGATYTINVDGSPVGTLDTRGGGGPIGGPTYFIMGCFRVPLKGNVQHTVTITTSTMLTWGAFFGYQLEQSPYPAVLVGQQYRLVDYSIYNTFGGTNPQSDATVDALNTTIASVVNEFDGSVVTVPTGRVMDKRGENTAGDYVHPGDMGHRLLASAYGQSLRACQSVGSPDVVSL